MCFLQYRLLYCIAYSLPFLLENTIFSIFRWSGWTEDSTSISLSTAVGAPKSGTFHRCAMPNYLIQYIKQFFHDSYCFCIFHQGQNLIMF